jgi:acyl carrier protein
MMSETTEILERVARLFADTLQRVVPSADTDLFESGLLDSLGFVDLLVHLEREFGTTIALDDLELDNFSSIVRIADFVRARTSASPVAGAVHFGGRF